MTTASRRLDRLIAVRDRLNERIRLAERDAEREAYVIEFCRTVFPPPYNPCRPAAGESMEK